MKELAHEPTLADARNADECERLRRAAAVRAFVRVQQRLPFAPPIDQRDSVLAPPGLSHARAWPRCLPARDGSGFTLRVDRGELVRSR